MTPAPADAQTIPYRRILVVVVVLILYGSLYPWQFHAVHDARTPLWILLHSWPQGFGRYIFWDAAVNIALYLPLGIFAFLSMRERATLAARLLTPAALGLLLSASVEMLQLFDDSRQCSLADVTANVAGTAVGIAAGVLYRARLQRFLERHEAASLLRPTGALLLLSCWLGYQVFPLFPVWGRTNLLHKWVALQTTPVSPVNTLIVFAEWIAVACLLESIRRKRARRDLLVLLLVVTPARLMIAGRTLTGSDILASAAAYTAWMVLPTVWIRRAAPLLLAGTLILGELSPFHFGAPQPFNWVPFRGFFNAAWQGGMVVLFRKSFWYGAVLWLWRAPERNLVWTTVAAAIALFLLERVQIYLPGRTPEITDAVLAMLMGLLLWLLRDA